MDADDLRGLVVRVLAAHFAELGERGDSWPRLSPLDALTDLSVGECSVLEHVEAVAHRLLRRPAA